MAEARLWLWSRLMILKWIMTFFPLSRCYILVYRLVEYMRVHFFNIKYNKWLFILKPRFFYCSSHGKGMNIKYVKYDTCFQMKMTMRKYLTVFKCIPSLVRFKSGSKYYFPSFMIDENFFIYLFFADRAANMYSLRWINLR